MVCLLTGLAFYFLYKANEQTPKQNIQLNSELLNNFTLVDHSAQRETEIYNYSQENGQFLTLEKTPFLDNKSANVIIKNEVIGLKALYDKSLTPYPGDVTREIIYNKKLRPKFLKKKMDSIHYTYCLLYSNDRFGLGVASEDQISYKHLIGWFYCPDFRELYKIKIFLPYSEEFSELEKILLSFSCKDT